MFEHANCMRAPRTKSGVLVVGRPSVPSIRRYAAAVRSSHMDPDKRPLFVHSGLPAESQPAAKPFRAFRRVPNTRGEGRGEGQCFGPAQRPRSSEAHAKLNTAGGAAVLSFAAGRPVEQKRHIIAKPTAATSSSLCYGAGSKFVHQDVDTAAEELIKQRAAFSALSMPVPGPVPIFQPPVDGNWCHALVIAARVCSARALSSLDHATGVSADKIRPKAEDLTPEEISALRIAQAKALERAARMSEAGRTQQRIAAAAASRPSVTDAAAAAQLRCLAAARRVRDKEEEAAIRQRALRAAEQCIKERELQPRSAAQDQPLTMAKAGATEPHGADDVAAAPRCAPDDGCEILGSAADREQWAIPARLLPRAPPLPPPLSMRTLATESSGELPPRPPAKIEVGPWSTSSCSAVAAEAVEVKEVPYDEEPARPDGRVKNLPNQPSFQHWTTLVATANHAGGLTGRTTATTATTASSYERMKAAGIRDGSATVRWAQSLTAREVILSTREEKIALTEIERSFKLAAAEEVLSKIDCIAPELGLQYRS